uniref:Uncharacterized protein n=1 Tax=Mimivirus LCMiAC01 TaxID=2506608 RepID=A0A481YYV3_9VIRU|nr:MAG: hypothetical protein LCMiAC01_01190 [Mimivirus LCMiAC01]
MGKNTGIGYRSGMTKNRCQVYNPRTKKYVKMNTETGRIMACKNEPFKNIRRKGDAKKNTKKNTKKRLIKAESLKKNKTKKAKKIVKKK